MIKINSILLLCCFSVFSQQNDIVIYATTHKNTSIFFQSPIKNGIIGSNNFTFGFNKEANSTYGILKAIPGNESNLLVTTENGNIFSFIVRYAKDVTTPNHFINDSLAIGNENGHQREKIIPDINRSEDNIINHLTINDYQSEAKHPKKTLQATHLYETDKAAYFKNISREEIDKPGFFRRFYATIDGVYIQLKNIHYNKNELYFTLIIDNTSSLDYDVNYLNFYLNSRKKNRRTTTQTLAYKPVFEYNRPERIKSDEKLEVVFVFEKFSINKNKVVQVELNETNGERNIILEIPNNYINNPN